MKLALLLPGYIESPDYRHLVVIDNKLKDLGYTTLRVDPCNLWQSGEVQNYTTTNYINQVKGIVEQYLPQGLEEIILIGHSLGSLVALEVGNIYEKVTKIVCLCPPIYLDRSDHKWVNGWRISKKDLPNKPEEFREFAVPRSYVEDRRQYSMINALRDTKKPFVIIAGEDDPLLADIKKTVSDLNISNFIKIKNMGHDFRQSEELCEQVAEEIERFIY